MTDNARTKQFERYTKSYLKNHPDEIKAVQVEHLKRILSGREKWNEWAKTFKAYVEGNNIDDAAIILRHTLISHEDFSGYNFPVELDLFHVTFRNSVDFTRAKFMGGVNFRETRFFGTAVFSHALFSHGIIGFQRATFSNSAYFSTAIFTEKADFFETRFLGEANFNLSKFLSVANFRKAMFSMKAYFVCSFFEDESKFSGAGFLDTVSFNNAKFAKKAYFHQVEFEGDAYFSYARFAHDAGFVNLHCNKALVLEGTKFINKVPDFRYSRMGSAPYLSNVEIPDKRNDSPENVQRYRKLKELANAARDHQKEIEFFAYEAKAARGIEEKNWLRQLPGRIYQLFSNFGQSLLRPLGWLVAVFLLSWATYYGMLMTGTPEPTPADWKCSAYTADVVWKPIAAIPAVTWKGPIEYSLRYTAIVALPFTTSSRQEKNQVTRCLFGSPVVPGKYKVVSFIQTLLTLLCLFLFGLGVRNRFKI